MNQAESRECSKCHETKIFTEFAFHHDRNRLSTICRVCQKTYQRERTHKKYPYVDITNLTLPLEKTEENRSICWICGIKYPLNSNLSVIAHARQCHHISAIEYYNRFYKTANENKCLECGKPTRFSSAKYEYNFHCSYTCSANNPDLKQRRNEKYIKTCLAKYGVKYASLSPIVRKKIEDFNYKKYGQKTNMGTADFKQKANITFLQKYGVINPFANQLIQEKIQNTILQKFGAKHDFSSPIMREKFKITMLKKYGAENSSQVPELLLKQQTNAYKNKPYCLPSGKIIFKQGYEPQFLDYIFQNNILNEDEIVYHPKGIKYMGRDNKQHIYFPDFYIPKWNLIIELKSTFTIQLDKNVYQKEKYTKKQGYRYLRLINRKNTNKLSYLKLRNFIKSFSCNFVE